MDAMMFDPEVSDPNPGAVHARKLVSPRRPEEGANGEKVGKKHEKHGKYGKTHDMKLQVE